MAGYKTRQLQGIYKEYEAAGLPLPVSMKEVAEWAIRTGRWKASASIEVSVCARELSRALREDYITDDTGRHVRVKHPVFVKRGDQSLHLWDDMRRASRDHMEMAFAQRRAQVVGDCHQLKTDVDFYNDLHPDAEPVQLVLDFSDDVAEMEAARRRGQPVKVPPKPEDEIDDSPAPRPLVPRKQGRRAGRHPVSHPGTR